MGVNDDEFISDIGHNIGDKEGELVTFLKEEFDRLIKISRNGMRYREALKDIADNAGFGEDVTSQHTELLRGKAVMALEVIDGEQNTRDSLHD